MKKLLVTGIAGMMFLLAGCNAGGSAQSAGGSQESLVANADDVKKAGGSIDTNMDSKGMDDKGMDGKGMESMGTGQGISDMKKIPEFKAKTSDGKDVSNDIFKDSKLTLVNVWGSWCHPCVEELPELQKVYEKMKDKGVNVVGIAQDSSVNPDAVKDIIKKGGLTYTNIFPEGKLLDAVMNNQAFPLTLLVDSEGNVVGEPLKGGSNEAHFTEMIEKALADMK